MMLRHRRVNIPEFETQVRRIIHEDPAGAPQRLVAFVHAAVMELVRREQETKTPWPLRVATAGIEFVMLALGVVIGHWVWR